MRKVILALLAFVQKQLKVKVTLSAICKYVNWIGMHGKIGDKNNYRKHQHIFLSKAHFYNLSRFRLGAWKLNVNSVNLKHINRSIRFCNYCTSRNNNIMEDEEHVTFGCPEYNTCRLKYPALFNLSENNIKDLFNIDDQESVSKFLWDIRNICVNSGGEC